MLPTAENNKGAKFAAQNLSMTGASDYKKHNQYLDAVSDIIHNVVNR